VGAIPLGYPALLEKCRKELAGSLLYRPLRSEGGAPFNSAGDCFIKKLRLNNSVRATQQA